MNTITGINRGKFSNYDRQVVASLNSIEVTKPPQLDCCDRQEILNYFENAWQLEDILFKSLTGDDTFYLNPDPLRNRLIFYLGHSAVFYINKLIQVQLLPAGLNAEYENLFEIGVDPEIPAELDRAIEHCQWPSVAEVWQYRSQAYQTIVDLIKTISIELPIRPDRPLWALMMGIEHQRIHIETSSMLIRQLPIDRVRRPVNWQYAPLSGKNDRQEKIVIPGGIVKLGKAVNDPSYGWDIDYGERTIEVSSFQASKYLVTNTDFRYFVEDGGYTNRAYWDESSWQWKTQFNIRHPKFWLPQTDDRYTYRAMFDELELPGDWPVEVNYYEAMAYCRWQGIGNRLMSEAEWQLATYGSVQNGNSLLAPDPDDYNLNFKFCSPSPVGMLATATSPAGLSDLRGNVWEWSRDNLSPLSGYQPHHLYPDNSAIFFDNKHQMMLGGCWITSGTEALKYYRNWFRPYFYQHAGFRVVSDL